MVPGQEAFGDTGSNSFPWQHSLPYPHYDPELSGNSDMLDPYGIHLSQHRPSNASGFSSSSNEQNSFPTLDQEFPLEEIPVGLDLSGFTWPSREPTFDPQTVQASLDDPPWDPTSLAAPQDDLRPSQGPSAQQDTGTARPSITTPNHPQLPLTPGSSKRLSKRRKTASSGAGDKQERRFSNNEDTLLNTPERSMSVQVLQAVLPVIYQCRDLLKDAASAHEVSMECLLSLLNPSPSGGITRPASSVQEPSQSDPIQLKVDETTVAEGAFGPVIQYVQALMKNACPKKPIKNQERGYLPCPKCKKGLPDPTSLRRHLEHTGPGEVKICPEPECGAIFHRKDRLPGHLRDEHRECSYNNESAARRASEARTILINFEGVCPFPKCEKKFKNFLDLYHRHYPSHFEKPAASKKRSRPGSNGDDNDPKPGNTEDSQGNDNDSNDANGHSARKNNTNGSSQRSNSNEQRTTHRQNFYRRNNISSVHSDTSQQLCSMNDISTPRGHQDATTCQSIAACGLKLEEDQSASLNASLYSPKVLSHLRALQLKRCLQHNFTRGRYGCPFGCGTSFPDKEKWLAHINALDPELLYTCFDCDSFFNSTAKLRLHVNDSPDHFQGEEEIAPGDHVVYEGFKKRVCGFCGWQCHEWSGFYEHVATHFEQGRKPRSRWIPSYWSQVDDDASVDENSISDGQATPSTATQEDCCLGSFDDSDALDRSDSPIAKDSTEEICDKPDQALPVTRRSSILSLKTALVEEPPEYTHDMEKSRSRGGWPYCEDGYLFPEKFDMRSIGCADGRSPIRAQPEKFDIVLSAKLTDDQWDVATRFDSIGKRSSVSRSTTSMTSSSLAYTNDTVDDSDSLPDTPAPYSPKPSLLARRLMRNRHTDGYSSTEEQDQLYVRPPLLPRTRENSGDSGYGEGSVVLEPIRNRWKRRSSPLFHSGRSRTTQDIGAIDKRMLRDMHGCQRLCNQLPDDLYQNILIQSATTVDSTKDDCGPWFEFSCPILHFEGRDSARAFAQQEDFHKHLVQHHDFSVDEVARQQRLCIEHNGVRPRWCGFCLANHTMSFQMMIRHVQKDLRMGYMPQSWIVNSGLDKDCAVCSAVGSPTQQLPVESNRMSIVMSR